MNDINCIGFKSSWCHHNTDMYTILFKYSISITSTLLSKIYLFDFIIILNFGGFFPHCKFPSQTSRSWVTSAYIYIKVNLVTLN